MEGGFYIKYNQIDHPSGFIMSDSIIAISVICIVLPIIYFLSYTVIYDIYEVKCKDTYLQAAISYTEQGKMYYKNNKKPLLDRVEYKDFYIQGTVSTDMVNTVRVVNYRVGVYKNEQEVYELSTLLGTI